jgi:hypothetical protein
MITVLAWMSLKLSLSLSALLTAILLPVAILRARESVLFSAMTLAMLGMMWRAEAWKTVYLQSERQLLEQRQPPQPQISPKTEFSYQSRTLLDVGARCAPRFAAAQFPALIIQCGLGTMSLAGYLKEMTLRRTNVRGTIVASEARDLRACLALFPLSLSKTPKYAPPPLLYINEFQSGKIH